MLTQVWTTATANVVATQCVLQIVFLIPLLVTPSINASFSTFPITSVSLPHYNAQINGFKYPIQSRRTNQTHDSRVFLGIPYARPPTGKYRFRKPEPYPWPSKPSSYNATFYRPPCPQLLDDNYVIGDEDCLHLNIFTPDDRNSSELRPVIFKVHGGSYSFGSSQFSPGHQLTDEGVVVVTINYRLGVLGYFAVNGTNSTGNYGLWDMVTALKWVHANIQHFGGDNRRVMVMGESAGASSVHLLALNPYVRNEDMVHRLFAVSGSMMSIWAVRSHTYDYVTFSRKAAAEISGCPSSGCSSDDELLEKMRAIPCADIVKQVRNAENMIVVEWSPVIDGDILPTSPEFLLKDCSFPIPMPYLTSVTANESAWYFNAPEDTEKMKKKGDFVTLNAFTTIAEDERPTIERIYQLNQMDPIQRDIKHFEIENDFTQVSPMYQFTLFASQKCFHPRIQMNFDYVSGHEPFDLYGPGHGDDLPYHFGYPFTTQEWWLASFGNDVAFMKKYMGPFMNLTSARDRKVSSRLMTMLADFAKYGKLDYAENISDLEYLQFTEDGWNRLREERMQQLSYWFHNSRNGLPPNQTDDTIIDEDLPHATNRQKANTANSIDFPDIVCIMSVIFHIYHWWQ